MTSFVRSLFLWLLAFALIGVGAEIGARLDDWAFLDVPLSASPNRERDLTVHDEHGFHGRPHGRFKKWKLNALGFRGPEIAAKPEPGARRLMVLGASETLGLYESEGKEYPAQLAELLRKSHPEVEVVNAAMAGMSLASMKPYWEQWARKAEPNIVLLYPSPMLYLSDAVPTAPPPGVVPAPEPIPASERLRIVPRFLDFLRQSEMMRPVRQARFRWRTAKSLEGKGDEWIWKAPPGDRLEAFAEDLRALARAIRKTGAEPILITHANRAPHPPEGAYLGELDSMRFFFPRARPEIITGFEVEARKAVRDVAEQEKIRCIDAAADLTSDRRGWFADEVHFTDAGAARMARTLADALEPVLKP